MNNGPGRLALLLGAGLGFWLVTALTNVGIIAVDDYTLLAKVLPAQAHSAAEVLEKADYRTPLPTLAHLGLAKVALALGLLHPLAQVRFNQAVVALMSFGLMWRYGSRVFRRDPSGAVSLQWVFAWLLGFYCLAPFFFTRPMVESLTAPLLLAGIALACDWWQAPTREALAGSLAALALAAVLRPQVGIVALALPLLLVVHRRWGDLAVFAGFALVALVLSGLPDLLLRERWHASLRGYVKFNLAHSSRFGVSPWHTYLPTLVLATLPPVFFARYRGLPWRASYRPLLPAVVAFVLFVVAHSAVPHKEERFLVPILPALLLLLTPLAAWLLAHGPRWRVVLFAVANTALLALIVTNPPQATAMALADWVDRNPQIDHVGLGGDRMFLPAAFITHPVTASDSLPASPSCGTALAVLSLGSAAPRLAADTALVRAARFEPGPIERVLVAINPKHNARRGAIDVYVRKGC